jgi:hypothetical protein
MPLKTSTRFSRIIRLILISQNLPILFNGIQISFHTITLDTLIIAANPIDTGTMPLVLAI